MISVVEDISLYAGGGVVDPDAAGAAEILDCRPSTGLLSDMMTFNVEIDDKYSVRSDAER